MLINRQLDLRDIQPLPDTSNIYHTITNDHKHNNFSQIFDTNQKKLAFLTRKPLEAAQMVFEDGVKIFQKMIKDPSKRIPAGNVLASYTIQDVLN
jgi:hypothetical protein